jgi:hypothetical protein
MINQKSIDEKMVTLNGEPVNTYEEKEQLLRKSYPAIRAGIRRHCSFLLDLRSIQILLQ